jgi:Zn finger protein HypA/HybF (possibly regulating hydrogenase expression)
MHEGYLFMSLLRSIEEQVRPFQPCRITKVVLLVGEYSGIDFDYLKAVVETFKEGSILEDAEVHLKRDPLRIYCTSCGIETTNYEAKACCPLCKSFDVEIRGGLELILASLEVERDEDGTDNH